ncbi:MAG: DUF1501 domain-containing protein [Planctomycetaceae bacterium]|nr:DUF1501 domain-containing protein [Planctomycetaceae bacterium]
MTQLDHPSGFNRRQAMHLGVGAWIGAGLVDMLRMQSRASDGRQARAKSCITIWLDGGPSHFETFDPKPDAPMEIRGELNPIQTRMPGVQFCQTLPRLAEISDKFTTIRSIRHDQGNHGAGNHYMTTGSPTRIPVGCGAFVSFHPSVGSVVAHELGKPNGLPAYFSIPSMNRSGGPNFLGAKYAPFIVADDPNSAGFRVRDVALPNGLVTDRFNRRTDLRKTVDRLKRIEDPAAVDPAFAIDADYGKGLDLVTSTSAQKAFDMKSESDSLRDEYGRNSFGQRMLLARRLVEAGVPFITMNHGGWDHHSGVFTELPKATAIVDQAVAALIRDLETRGLLDSTLIVMLGEFGRTPKISTLPGAATAGRDHWSNAMSVLMAGAGTPGGLCLGATDRHGYSAVDRVLSPENFVSTIYRKLGIDPDKVLYTPQGRPSHIVSDPTPIIEVMG